MYLSGFIFCLPAVLPAYKEGMFLLTFIQKKSLSNFKFNRQKLKY